MKNTLRAKLLTGALVAGLGISLGLANVAGAAGTDVALTANVTVHLATQNLDFTILSGSTMASYVINAGTIVFNLDSGSSVTLQSADRVDLTNTYAGVSCTSSYTQTVLAGATSATAVTITPGTTLSSSCSPSGGGGPGGGYTPPPSTPPPVTPPPVVPPTTSAHPVGSNIKLSNGEIDFIATGSCRRAYTSWGAFISYGFNTASSIVDANSADLALSMCSAGFVPPQDGQIIFSDRGSDKGTGYFISLGTKRGFVSAAVFLKLGYKFGTGYAADVSWMLSGANIDNGSAAHPVGALINQDGTIYLVGSSGKLGIPSMTVFGHWGYSLKNVVTANAADRALRSTGAAMNDRGAGDLSPNVM